MIKITLILSIWASLMIAGFASLPSINAWEKAHDYPYGRMCDPNIFNGYHSTCR